jgi:predicted GNAT family acetyltransferase
MSEEIAVSDNPERARYELRHTHDDGSSRVIGIADYVLTDDEHVDFVHTEVDEAYAGQGLAGRLVAFALADVREHGRRVIPHCPYVQAWLERHPGEYDDLVDWPV